MPTPPRPIPRQAPGQVRTWCVPGSKSITNRVLLLAALAEGESRISNTLESDDTRRMQECLQGLGIAMSSDGPGVVVVQGGRSRLKPAPGPLFVGNSGTTVRFLTGLATLVPGPTTFQGDEHMAKRPIADLVDGLAQIGVVATCPTGCPPLTIPGGGFPGGLIRMRGDRSSQYFSALLLTAGLGARDLLLEVEGTLVSRPYVAMTNRMVADFGGRIEERGDGFIVRAVPSYRPRAYVVEPDASSASYPFAFAAAGGHTITVPHLDATSLQGDYAFVDVLERMGAKVLRTPGSTTVSGTGTLRGVDVDMHHISDTVMTLAAIAPLADGPTTIRNIANIRIKETDRLAATVTELQRLGQEVEHGDDWLRITPKPLRPAVIHCYADHRMAMSFGVLGALAGGITIADPDCTAKTYPDFWKGLAG